MPQSLAPVLPHSITASAEKINDTLGQIRRQSLDLAAGSEAHGPSQEMSFADHLRKAIGQVDSMAKSADKMTTALVTGKSGNIHETMLAATQAELSFNLMVQIRNKALEAYGEVMKMPV